MFLRLYQTSRIFSKRTNVWTIIPRRRGTTSSVDQHEVKKFEHLADSWWNTTGTYKALHTMNELRIPFIRDKLLTHSNCQAHDLQPLPLCGFHILDVGCGGGLLSEPLARLGAEVTGVDVVQLNIDAAQEHANFNDEVSKRVKYLCSPVEELDPTDQLYDGVVASEIIEHVQDQQSFVSNCCKLVKPGGSIFFTTINKTVLSRALAVFAAENILKIVPRGVHDWEKFISPEDLSQYLSNNNFSTRCVHGMLLNPLTLRWRWISDSSINFALHAVKTDS